ncbi:hypothetical protein AOL_s00080g395 [Orbilia oligospora ATCC 24927]|uniref:Uncharacterized protein n=1 Tax=Arthrobotrys oligospora (strain ATCC 24927 / CBS 115.81 / DSM 1491) TaxID=756982 RepID=G1XF10_ARTOA|nr:hypothetical protein AOL_s00080g395 [Orbilia oligospora ATCC 24927]EGX48270.1 hypothetical protein AOL_s00080g395 [Orbilia oligospora ATCC 24927]
MIYAAACQRIQTRAKLTNENLKKAFDFVKIFTDLTGFLYPLHSYDLQVEICVKLALFQLLLSDKDAIKEFEKLRSYMASGPAFNAMNTSSPVVDSRFIHYLAEEAGFIPPSPSEISPPSSPMRTDGPSKGKGFGSISQTRVQLALMESIIHTLVQSRSSIGQQNEKGIKIQSEKFNMEGLFKILPNWIFPLDEFDEEEYGKIYLPVTENFVGFTRAVSQISLTLIEQTKSSPISGQTITDSQEIYQVSTIMAACNTHHSKLQVPRVALEETLNCYTSLRKSFQPHPQLWKFADAYLRGFVGATLGSSEGFKNLFMSDWKIVLQNEWHKKRTSTNMFSYRRMSAASNANEMEVDEVEVPIKSESVRRKSIVEEYDSWEFLR